MAIIVSKVGIPGSPMFNESWSLKKKKIHEISVSRAAEYCGMSNSGPEQFTIPL